VTRLGQDGIVEKQGISPNFLVRNWPPAFTEWSTKSVRDAFFASPQFPRLLDGEAVRDTIARGVSNNILAYFGKVGDQYKPFVFESSLSAADVEVSDDMFIMTAEEAKKHVEPPRLTALTITPEAPTVRPGARLEFQAKALDQHGRPMTGLKVTWTATGGKIDAKGGFTAGSEVGEYTVEALSGEVAVLTAVVVTKEEIVQPPKPSKPTEIKGLYWTGDVPPQKWMNFYTKVLAKYATTGGLKLTICFEVSPENGLLPQRLEEARAALHELGLNDDVRSLP